MNSGLTWLDGSENWKGLFKMKGLQRSIIEIEGRHVCLVLRILYRSDGDVRVPSASCIWLYVLLLAQIIAAMNDLALIVFY